MKKGPLPVWKALSTIGSGFLLLFPFLIEQIENFREDFLKKVYCPETKHRLVQKGG